MMRRCIDYVGGAAHRVRVVAGLIERFIALFMTQCLYGVKFIGGQVFYAF